MKITKEHMSNAFIRAKQKKHLIIALSVSAIILLAVVGLVGDDKKVTKSEKTKTKLVTALDSIEPGDLWLYKSESRLDEQDQSIKDIKKDIDRISRQPVTAENEAQVNQELESRILFLEEQIVLFNESTQLQQLPTVGGAKMPTRYNSYDDVEVYETEPFVEPMILSLDMGLKKTESSPAEGYNISNFIPVGSFAKSVLLTGVDAPAAVSSADNPVPMVLRIIDNAVLPRGMRGEIDTCHVTASAYGEISEERVRVRLDKISCTYLDGRIFVDNIDGYVTGEDGKSGIRGKVVWREGALITRSFAAGFLGGVSQGIGDAAGEISTSPLGTVQTYPGSELFQQGIGTGAGSALNKLSEYYIKRAEQYHPVIEVEAGRLVDIVISTRKDSKSNGLKLGDAKK
jgi:conjugal transfer pilus assembly protein TraB